MPTPTPDDAATEVIDSANSVWRDLTANDLLVRIPLQIALILLIAIVVQFVLSRLINKAADRSIRNPGGKLALRRHPGHVDDKQAKAQEGRRQARIRTLSNVGRSAVAIVIWVWATLAVLDKLGVNVAPLIASAGVVGVAIGFGAQSLVKDFLSGIFMLLENQYGVGDTIAIDDVEGTVENMTLRVTTLRDIDGVLWYIRNGDIERVGNQSNTYSVARLEVPVSLTADPRHAGEVIQEAAVTSAGSERIRGSVIEDPELLGVSKFETDYMTYRVTVKTMPGDQWSVSRAMYEDILDALQKAGITLPGTQPLLVKYPREGENDKEQTHGGDLTPGPAAR